METTELMFAFLGLCFWLLYRHISELHSKIDIVMNSVNPNWEEYFTDEIYSRIEEGKPEKAADLLRQKTGLSLVCCLSIIKSHRMPRSVEE